MFEVKTGDLVRTNTCFVRDSFNNQFGIVLGVQIDVYSTSYTVMLANTTIITLSRESILDQKDLDTALHGTDTHKPDVGYEHRARRMSRMKKTKQEDAKPTDTMVSSPHEEHTR
jgi:hypothetical protein